MDFDFARIAVPFRMQPGLQRMAAGAPHFNRLDPASTLYLEKRRVVEAGQAVFCAPGFDCTPAHKAIAAHSLMTGVSEAAADAHSLALQWQEDFAVLDGASTRVPYLCVCVPSRWAPEDKLGQSFAEIHGPVADNASLIAASQALTRLVSDGGHWERFVWNLTPAPGYDQHPVRQPRTPWPDAGDAAAVAASCYFRAEHQTFLPVGPGSGQVVFTIRVMMQPLVQAVASVAQARRLHDALLSMSDAVLSYKGLAHAREPLCRWLQEFVPAPQRTGSA